MKLLSLAVAAAMLSPSIFAEVQAKSVKIGKTTVQYKVILPKNYDPAKAYPAVLAFGGGPKTMDVVDRTIQRNWRKQAEAREYLVILPGALDGVLFFEGGEKIFPEFITKNPGRLQN